MPTAYGRILRRPGALRFSAAGLLARFPMSMVGISTILAVQDLYGSYSAAGAVSAANIVATAVGAPLLARLVDAHGQARVMAPALVASSASLLALAAAAQHRAAPWSLIALSALAGALSGSMGSLVRSRWTALLKSPDDIHTAFSLEAALDETAFMIGPVLATALCTTPALPVTSGWIAAMVLQTGGGLWFLSQRATEPAPHPRRRRTAGPGRGDGERGAAERARGPAAPEPTPHRPVLAHGAVVSIAVIFLTSGAMFGANDVTVVAFATELGQKPAAGAALAAWAAGSFLAALAYGSRSWGWPLWKQLAAGALALALGASTFTVAPNLAVLSALYVLTGLAIAPTITSGNNIVQVTVAPSQLTEGLAWVSTALNIGVSLGSMVAGRVLDASGSRGGYLLVAGFAWVGAAVTAGSLRILRRARTHSRVPLEGRPDERCER